MKTSRNQRRYENQTVMVNAAKHPPGPPMTLGNMRELGVRGLAVYCLNHACRHQTVISADGQPNVWGGPNTICDLLLKL